MHTHGPKRGAQGVRVGACETIVPPSIQLILQPIQVLSCPVTQLLKSQTAGRFITLESLQAKPYVAGKETWPKPEDSAGTIPAPPPCFTFLLQPTANKGKVHANKAGKQLFCEQLNDRLNCVGQWLGSRICHHLEVGLAFVSSLQH